MLDTLFRALKRSNPGELCASVSRLTGAGSEKNTNTKKEGVKPTLVDCFEGGLLLRMVSYIAHP